MNAPVRIEAPFTDATPERPAYIARARLYERRLKAALHRTNSPDVRSLYRKLRRARRKNERAIVLGPYPECAYLRSFLTEWGPMIVSTCKWGRA